MAAPTGTVTFLFTDIEGSTRLWEQAPEAMRAALARHDGILRAAIEANDGLVFATGGDGFAAAFARSADGLAAAGEAQARLAEEPWPEGAHLRVRMGLHTGEVEERGGDYFGPAVNRAARIMGAAHGGQVLVSGATAALLGGHGLADLGEHAFAGLAGPERVFQYGVGTFPPLRALGAVPTNLPTERSVFIGREREMAAVAGLVRSSRVVTLSGVGGVGKTRLAIQTAAGLVAEFPGGVWLVELAPLIDAALVATAVASAIGAPPVAGIDSTETVCRFLATRRALVVLDNCEHVIDAAAALVDRVLGAAARVRVLATSREPLTVTGESVWRVPSLSVEVDGTAGDAVELFADRAAQARPGFNLDDGTTRESVVAVCQRLDGIPLAIELAAARARAMSVEQIAAHLDARFRLLTRGARTAVPRQQTLQGAIDWSYELLGADERALFDTLGVFAGSFEVTAVGAVAGLDELEALDLVDSLVGKSMVEADPGRDRYELLETLRQYAWDRLMVTGRLEAVRDAHAAHFSGLAAEQAKLMNTPRRQVGALDRLEADYDNLRAALAHLIAERRAADALRLLRRLLGLFNIRHPREGYGWCQQVIGIADGLPATSRSRLLAQTAHAAMNAGDVPTSARYALEAIDLGGDDAPADAHWLAGQWAMRSGEWAVGLQHALTARSLATAANDPTTDLTAAGMQVIALARLGDVAGTRELIPKVLELAEQLGNPTLTASTYISVAEAMVGIASPEETIAMIDKGMPYADNGGPIAACSLRAMYALASPDPVRAARVLRTAIGVAQEQCSGYHLLLPLVAAAKVVAQLEDQELAARLLGTYAHGRDALITGGYLSEDPWRIALVEDLTTTLGAAAVDQEARQGIELSPVQALQLAAERIDKELSSTS